VVLQVLPDDLNRVEFRAVRREVHQHQAAFEQPFVQFFGVDFVMGAGIVHQRQRHPLHTLGDAVDQGDHGVAPDRLGVQVLPNNSPGDLVQRAYHVHPRPGTGIRSIGLAFERPRPLHAVYRAKTALVQVKQAQLARLCRRLATLEVGLRGLELVGAAFFFSDNRVRLKDSPRFFSPLARQSRLNGGASGWCSRNAWSICAKVQGAAWATASAVSSSSAVNFAGAPP